MVCRNGLQEHLNITTQLKPFKCSCESLIGNITCKAKAISIQRLGSGGGGGQPG